MRYKANNNVYFSCKYHVVWCTKYRRNVLVDGAKEIKGVSSKILRNQFRQLKSRLPSLWTNSYFVATTGGAPLALIKQYIENQKHV